MAYDISEFKDISVEEPEPGRLIVGIHLDDWDLTRGLGHFPDIAIFETAVNLSGGLILWLDTDGLEASNHDGGAVIRHEFQVTHWKYII